MTDNVTRVKTLLMLISSYSYTYSQKSSQGENINEETLAILVVYKELDVLLTPPKIWISRIARSYNYSTTIYLALNLDIPSILLELNLTPLYLVVEYTRAVRSLLSIKKSLL